MKATRYAEVSRVYISILITGGAGYIGSATVELLCAQGERVLVLDNLSRGHHSALERGVIFYQGSVSDRALIARITREHNIEACIHLMQKSLSAF